MSPAFVVSEFIQSHRKVEMFSAVYGDEFFSGRRVQTSSPHESFVQRLGHFTRFFASDKRSNSVNQRRGHRVE